MLSVMHRKLSNDLVHMFHANYEFMVKIILYRTVWTSNYDFMNLNQTVSVWLPNLFT